MLLRSQKAELYMEVEQFEPTLLPRLSWRIDSRGLERLVVEGCDYHFTVVPRGPDTFVRFSPGAATVVEEHRATRWDAKKQLFSLWLRYLSRELAVPDYWGALATMVKGSGLDLTTQRSEPLSYSDVAQVSKALDVIKGLLITYAKADESMIGRIERDVAGFKEAAKSQDKRSLSYQLVGFVASTAVSMALAPDQTRALWEALKAGLGSVLLLGH